MAITLPQDQQRVQLRAQPSAQFSGAKGATIGSKFLNTLQRGVEAKSKAERDALLKRKNEQEKFLKKKYKNTAAGFSLVAKSKATNAKGENAIQESQNQRAELAKNLKDATNKIPAEFQHLIAGENDSAMLDFERSAVPHELGEISKLKNEAFKTDTANQMFRAVEMSANDDAFALGLQDVRNSAEDTARLKFGGDVNRSVGVDITTQDLIDDHVSKISSATITRAIEQKAGLGDSAGARQTLLKFGDQLRPDDLLKSKKFLDKADQENKSTIAYEISNQAIAEHPDNEEAQVNFIKSLTDDGGVFKEGVSLLRSNNAMRSRQKKAQEDIKVADAFNKAEDIAKNGGAISSEYIRSVPVEFRSRVLSYIEKRAKGADIVTKPSTWRTLNNMYRTRREEFSTLNLGIYADEISQRDIRSLTSLQNNVINGEASNENRIKMSNDKAVSDIVDEFAKGSGIFDDEGLLKLSEIAREAYTDLQDVKGITPQEIRNRVSKALFSSDIVKPEEKGFLGFGDSDAEIREGATLNVDLTPLKGDVNIHPSIMDGIQASRVRKGLPPATEAEMRKYADSMEAQGRDISKPLRTR